MSKFTTLDLFPKSDPGQGDRLVNRKRAQQTSLMHQEWFQDIENWRQIEEEIDHHNDKVMEQDFELEAHHNIDLYMNSTSATHADARDFSANFNKRIQSGHFIQDISSEHSEQNIHPRSHSSTIYRSYSNDVVHNERPKLVSTTSKHSRLNRIKRKIQKTHCIHQNTQKHLLEVQNTNTIEPTNSNVISNTTKSLNKSSASLPISLQRKHATLRASFREEVQEKLLNLQQMEVQQKHKIHVNRLKQRELIQNRILNRLTLEQKALTTPLCSNEETLSIKRINHDELVEMRFEEQANRLWWHQYRRAQHLSRLKKYSLEREQLEAYCKTPYHQMKEKQKQLVNKSLRENQRKIKKQQKIEISMKELDAFDKKLNGNSLGRL